MINFILFKKFAHIGAANDVNLIFSVRISQKKWIDTLLWFDAV